jgi:hypothetical protein
MPRFALQTKIISHAAGSTRFGLYCLPLRAKRKKGLDNSRFGLVTEMARQATVVVYTVLLAAVVVGVDVLFFRNRFWERLMANIGIVLVFAAFYLRFLKHP